VIYTVNGVLDTLVATQDTVLNFNLTDTTTYQLVSVSDANTCVNTSLVDNVVVNVHELPNAALSGDATICIGDAANITIDFTAGNPNYVVVLDTGATTMTFTATQDTTLQFFPSDTTTYSIVSIDDVNGCSRTMGFGSDATINVNPLPLGTLSTSSPICEGDTAILTVNFTQGESPFDIIIEVDNGMGTSTIVRNDVVDGDTILVTPTVNTSYNLISITDDFGCSNTLDDAQLVVVNALPTASFTFVDSTCFGEITEFTSNSIAVWMIRP